MTTGHFPPIAIIGGESSLFLPRERGVWGGEGLACPERSRGIAPPSLPTRERGVWGGEGTVAPPRVIPGRAGVILGNLAYPSRHLNTEAFHALATEYFPTTLPPPLKKRLDEPIDSKANNPARALADTWGWKGPTFCIDAACASSLYAIKLACDFLHRHEVDLMVSGGINVVEDDFLHAGFSALQALSPSGRCRPFSKRADGLVPSRASAFVLLQRLDDALRDGKRIIGVIRGIGLSNDGRAGGLLSPSSKGQIAAMRKAYMMSGLSPSDVSYIECHATGTPVGDKTELASLHEVFKHSHAPIALGVLKGKIGHALTASGALALINILNSFEEQKLPPSQIEDPLEELGERFYVNTQEREWSGSRMAAVNAFGFGGNNAHLLVSNHARGATVPSPPSRSPSPFFIETFDEHRFQFAGIPAKDLPDILPQQLNVVKAVRSALSKLPVTLSQQTGIIVGMTIDPYVCRYSLRLLLEREGVSEDFIKTIVPPLDATRVLGCMPNVPANRMNVLENWKGPSFTVCDPTLTQETLLGIARNFLQNHEADAMVVVNVDAKNQTKTWIFPLEDEIASRMPLTPILPLFGRPVKYSRKDLLEHASGKLSNVFGPNFIPVDRYEIRVRMPEPPLLLVDRVTKLDAEAGSLGLGKIETETDVKEGAWYLKNGRMSPGLSIEAGQADLFLISFLGVDFELKGERAYRLLGCEATFHRDLPRPGETLRFTIEITGHAKSGATRLFFFKYDCFIGNDLFLTVRHGQAGFFSKAELIKGEGELEGGEGTVAPLEYKISPDDWFFKGHFKNDPCMPGTLMTELCFDALEDHLRKAGLVPANRRVIPVIGRPCKLICRAQVIPTSEHLSIEVNVKHQVEVPSPMLIADVVMKVDGVLALRAEGLGVQVAPPEIPDVIQHAISGQPSLAFGPAFRCFDGGKHVARLPGPPYTFLTRIVATDVPYCEMKQGSSLSAEWDVDLANPLVQQYGGSLPFCVLQEILLQPCGWLATLMGCPLRSEQELFFRNLQGTMTILSPPPSNAQVIRTKVRNTSVSQVGDTILVSFAVEASAGHGPVFMTTLTTFGYFPQSSTPPNQGGEARRGGNGPFAREIQPDNWFFSSHFYKDPVMPGSLGIQWTLDAMEKRSLPKTTKWKYRGQVLPHNKSVLITADAAKAELFVDGHKIYDMTFSDFL